jgi:hypothetical protein
MYAAYILSVCIGMEIIQEGVLFYCLSLFDSSPLLWVHAVLAVAFLILLVGLMRHFHINLEFQEDEQVSRTLMISGIPHNQCFKNQISQHFE